MLMPKRFRRAYEIGQEAVSKSAERRRIQGRAAAILADEIGVTFDPKLQKALLDGQEKAINRAREQLKTTGIFNLSAEQAFDKFVNRKVNREIEQIADSREQRVDSREQSGSSFDESTNKAPTKAVQAAVAPVSEDKSERERQGRAIKVVARANEVELPAAVIKPLEEGATKAIERSQEILRDNGALPPIEGIKGRDADVLTGSGKSNIKTQYRVVEADDLIDSDNANYPQELQPRDRNRKAMQQQVAQIANNPRAELLMESTNPNQGAPTVRSDGVVLNGNGRTMGLKGAYAQNTAGGYRQAIIDNAERLGLDADEVSKMNKPVLVRVPTHNLSNEQMQDVVTDTTGGSRMSVTDQAEVDSKKLDERDFSGYQTDKNDNIDLTLKPNRDFLGNILGKVSNQNDLAAYTSKGGAINRAGIERTKNALYSAAYQDDGLIETLAESPDNNIKNITTALTNAAPDFAAMNARIAKGQQKDFNLAKSVADAVKKLSTLRDEGTSVKEYLSSQQFDNDEYSGTQTKDSAAMRQVLAGLDENKNNVKALTGFLKRIVKSANELGDFRQVDMFGETAKATPEEIAEAARGSRESANSAADDRAEGEGQRAEEENPAEIKKTSQVSDAKSPNLNAQSDPTNVFSAENEPAFDGSPTHPTTAAVNSARLEEPNNKDGVEPQRDIAKTNSPADSVAQKKEKGKGKEKKLTPQELSDAIDDWMIKVGAVLPPTKNETRLNEAPSKNIADEVAEKEKNEKPKNLAVNFKNTDKGVKMSDDSNLTSELKKQIDELAYAYDAEEVNGEYQVKVLDDREGFIADVEDLVKTEKLKAGREAAKTARAKWTDERLDEVVKNNPNLKNAVKQFNGTTLGGHVHFKKSKDRKNFIKHLENLQNPDFKLSIAYHGSPHDFDTFSTDAIGTGEGAQAHGWGIYFAKGRAVSEGYRKALSQRGKGKLFKVDIPDADVMLDEQKNFANQSPKVQKMIETALNGLTAQQKEKFFEKHIKLISRPKRSQAFQEAQEALQTLINAQNAVKNYHKSAFKGLPIRTMSKVLTNEEVEQVKASVENAENIADSLNGKIEEAQNRLEEEEKRESEEFERKQFEYEEQISRYKKDTFALFKEKPLSGKEVYDGLETAFNGSSELASRYLNKNGIQGITYDGERDGRCYVVFDDKAIKILEKWSRQGEGKATVENFVDPKDLTDQQRGIAEIGEQFGVPVVFFKGDSQLNGAHANGITYLNVNIPINPRWIFWHESGHWLKAQHPDLISDVIDTLGITKKQVEDFRERTGRYDLTDDEVREEIFADNMFDADKRLDILQKLGKKDDSLLDRLVSWLKSVMDRVTSYFNTPKYGLTNSQKNQMFAELGKALRQIKDSEGNQRYRYGNTTRVVQYADGRELPVYSMAREKVTETKKATVKVTGDEFGEYSGIEELRDKAIQYYRNNLQGTSVTNKELGKIDIDKNGLIDFTTSGRKKLQSSSRERKKLLLIKHLPELLKSATNVRSVKANKEKHNHEGFYYMNNDVEINGQNMPVHITLIKRNNGDVQFYNYNFVEQTENTPVKPARPESPEGALGTLPVGVSSENSVNQNQEKVKGEIKYSIGNSEEQTRGWFSNLFESFAKKAHLRGDRIITAEDMAARQREQQNKAIDKYIADPSKENLKAARDLGVSNGMINARKNGEEYLTELGVNDSIRRSPARIAEKVPLFKAFWGMADRAMKKLVLGRDQYSKKLNAAFDVLNDEEMKTLSDLLFAGDAEQVDYSELTKEERAELGENAGHKEYDKARIAKIVREHEGVNEKVAGAFVKIRQLITKMANEIDKARQTTRNPSKWLTSDEIEALKNNKFVLEIRKIGDHETRNGKRLVSWKEYAHFEPKDAYTIDEATLDRFERDDTIQVLSKRKLSDGMYEVKTREQLGRINRIQGYIPHLFHDFMIRVVKDGKVVESYGFGGVIGSGRTQRDAVKMAEEWKKEHQLAEGEEIYIAPKMANFGKEFEDAYAPIMGDKDYDTMVHKIAKNNGIKLKDAKAMVDGSVKLRNRHRFLGSLLKRQGAKGYVQDMQYVLRHYFNSGSRYVALETEFKPQAISLFERVFGAFGDDWSGNSLAKYTKDFINDINGNPTHIETILNKAINSSPVFRNFLVPIFGERAALTFTTNLSSLTAVAKLGVFNPSSALLNYTQLVNAGGYLGGYSRLLKHAARLVGHKLTQSELRILTEAGTLQDIGLDTSTGYDKNRGYGNLLMQLGNKTMYFFKQADTHCRVATTLAAFEKAISEGKTRQEAIKYAKDVNRKANFSYGVEDAPNMFRRTGPVGKVVLQFQKYPIKQLEIWGDMLSNKTTRAQKAAFWIPYFFMVGLMGFIPVGDWLDDVAKKLSGYSPKDLVQDTAIKWAGKDADKQMIAKVAMYGAGATLNIDTSKRAGLSDIMPDDFTDFMLGAMGSTVWNAGTNAAEGFRANGFAFSDVHGDYANALRSVSPGAYNIYAAIEGESRGKRGRVNTVYEDMWDRIVRGLGFRSVDESLDADTKRILNNEQKRYTKERQSVIDALVADPYDEEARKRAKELGITGKQVKEERKKKSMTNRQRIEENMSKRQKKEYQYLADFAG